MEERICWRARSCDHCVIFHYIL